MTDPVALSLRLAALTGRVNAEAFHHEVRDKVTVYPAGTLLVQQTRVERDDNIRVAITLAHDAGGWNNFPAPDGERYPVRDSKGQPVYLPTDLPPATADWLYQVVDVVRNKQWFSKSVRAVRGEPVADVPLSAEPSR